MSEAVMLSLFQRALAGNVPATRKVMKIMEKVAADQKALEEKSSPLVYVITSPELRDCNAALKKLGIIQQYTNSWRICTWAVEAALSRNNQLHAKESDREIIAVPSTLATIGEETIGLCQFRRDNLVCAERERCVFLQGLSSGTLSVSTALTGL
jgi:hypothetical protein